MNKFQEIINEIFSKTTLGTYYLNRYFFTINTGKTREEAGLSDEKMELNEKEQKILQQENLPVIFHEYLHYIQETSTIVGHAIMRNSIMMKSIFTTYSSRDIQSAESLGSANNHNNVIDFANAAITNGILEGSGVLEIRMTKIEKIVFKPLEVHFPTGDGGEHGIIETSVVTYLGYDNGSPAFTEITLGRFYLYEFLSYELDQMIEQRQNNLNKISDPNLGTEYTVCRMVALYESPTIKIEIALSLALLSLQHINSGVAYVQYLRRIKQAELEGVSQEKSISVIKSEISDFLSFRRTRFFLQQDGFIRLFEGRSELEIAYTYMTGINKKLYDLRISNPCFELEWIQDRKYEQILSHAEMCDYMYVFKDNSLKINDPAFFRDFMVTSLAQEVSQALKVLAAFDHYFYSHMGMSTVRIEANPKSEHCCPFFTCCKLSVRKDHSQICKTKPWRMYEIYHPTGKDCWYSSAVLESKGTTRKKTVL